MGIDDDRTNLGEVVVKAVTDKALLVVLLDIDEEEHWVPKSCLDSWGDIDEGAELGDEGGLHVKTWWAEKEGLA